MNTQESRSSCFRVCIILVNWNGWRDTQRCLESLFSGTEKNFRVIVCDNDSSDGSVEAIADWATNNRISHLKVTPDHLTRAGFNADDNQLLLVPTGSNSGFAAGCNIGLDHVIKSNDYDFAWLLNNDTVVDPGTLEALLKAASNDQYDRPAGCAIYDLDQPERLQVYGGQRLGWGPLINPRHCRQKDRIDYLVGASIFISMQRLFQLGLMNEDFFLNAEDLVYTLEYQKDFHSKHPDIEPFLVAGKIFHQESSSQGRNLFLHSYYYSRNILLVARELSWLSFATTSAHALLRIIKAVCLLRFANARGIAAGVVHAMINRHGSYSDKRPT